MGVVLHHVGHPRLLAVDPGLFPLHDPDHPLRRGVHRRRPLGGHADPHHQAEHLVGPVRLVMFHRHRVEHPAVGIQLDHLGEVGGVVAVEDPVAGPVRLPGDPEGRQRNHHLGHRHVRVRRGVRGVPQVIHPEIEAVEVHRVVGFGEVDHPPVDRVALGVLQAFGVGPRPPVDGHDAPAEPAGTLRVAGEVPGDGHDPVGRSLRGVHHDGAVELHLVRGPAELRIRAAAGVVEIGSRRGRREPERDRGARWHDQGVAQAPRGPQPPDGEGAAQGVVEGTADLGADRHPDQRTRGEERLPDFGKGGEAVERLAAFAVGLPGSGPGFQRHREHPVGERAGGVAVVVGLDRLGPGGAPRSGDEYGAGDEGGGTDRSEHGRPRERRVTSRVRGFVMTGESNQSNTAPPGP